MIQINDADATNAAPLFVNIKGLAKMLDVGAHTIRRMDDGGKLPAPDRFGGRGKRGTKRWLIAEIRSWAEHGRPNREKWEAMKRLL